MQGAGSKGIVREHEVNTSVWAAIDPRYSATIIAQFVGEPKMVGITGFNSNGPPYLILDLAGTKHRVWLVGEPKIVEIGRFDSNGPPYLILDLAGTKHRAWEGILIRYED